MELTDIMKDEIIPIQASIHDCASTLGEVALSNGVRTLYTNDKLVNELKNGTTDLWDSVTSTVRDSILWSKVDIIVGARIKSTTASVRLKFEIVIPAGGIVPSETEVTTLEYEFAKEYILFLCVRFLNFLVIPPPTRCVGEFALKYFH